MFYESQRKVASIIQVWRKQDLQSKERNAQYRYWRFFSITRPAKKPTTDSVSATKHFASV